MDKWIKKMQGTYSHSGILLSIKNCSLTKNSYSNIMLIEISPSQKDKYWGVHGGSLL
jgi:hypothetical protein